MSNNKYEKKLAPSKASFFVYVMYSYEYLLLPRRIIFFRHNYFYWYLYYSISPFRLSLDSVTPSIDTPSGLSVLLVLFWSDVLVCTSASASLWSSTFICASLSDPIRIIDDVSADPLASVCCDVVPLTALCV